MNPEQLNRARDSAAEIVRRAERLRAAVAEDPSALNETLAALQQTVRDIASLIAANADGEPFPAAATPEAPKPATLLVVDDSDVNRLLLRRRLQAGGYQVEVASDGREALAKIDDGQFDLVLLDVMMPEVGGLEVLETVRKRFSVADLPIIMATANDESADIVAALQLGANDYVTKPFDFGVVLARISTQLALRRAMEENRRLIEQVELRNRFIRRVFGRYVDHEIVSQLLESQEALSLGGEKRNVSVLMCDLRGFTQMAERLPPESVVAIINNYLGVMTDVIMESGGTIDEFIGDAILVLFGAPVARPDHARSAVRCALRMQRTLESVNRMNSEQNLPSIAMGIGINTGEVVVGNIGSERRTKYGVVGRNVNLASRIESCTVGGQILISETTLTEAGTDLVCEGTLEVHPKGFPQPITLYDVRGIRGEDLDLSERPADLVQLSSPIPVRVGVIEGKDAGGGLDDGELSSLSSSEAIVRGIEPPAVLANVRLHFRLGDEAVDTPAMYAKVIDVPDGTGTFRIRFTSIPDVAAEKIGEVLEEMSMMREGSS